MGLFQNKDEKIQSLENEVIRLREKIRQLNEDYGFEVRDPNGTIWDEANRLQEENIKLKNIIFRKDKALKKVLDGSSNLNINTFRIVEEELLDQRE